MSWLPLEMITAIIGFATPFQDHPTKKLITPVERLDLTRFRLVSKQWKLAVDSILFSVFVMKLQHEDLVTAALEAVQAGHTAADLLRFLPAERRSEWQLLELLSGSVYSNYVRNVEIYASVARNLYPEFKPYSRADSATIDVCNELFLDCLKRVNDILATCTTLKITVQIDRIVDPPIEPRLKFEASVWLALRCLLERLVPPGSTFVNIDVLKFGRPSVTLLTQNQRPQSLHGRENQVTDTILGKKALPLISSLGVEIDLETSPALFQSLVNLNSLTLAPISGIRSNDDFQSVSIAISSLQKIQSLELYRFLLPCYSPRIRTLHCQCLKQLTNTELRQWDAILKISSLEKLSIDFDYLANFCDLNPYQTTVWLYPPAALCTNLRLLHIYAYQDTRIISTFCQTIFSACNFLEIVDLQQISISKECFQSISSRSLTKLFLSNKGLQNPLLSWTLVLALIQACPRLKECSLNGVLPMITFDHITQFAQTSVLQTLRLGEYEMYQNGFIPEHGLALLEPAVSRTRYSGCTLNMDVIRSNLDATKGE